MDCLHKWHSLTAWDVILLLEICHPEHHKSTSSENRRLFYEYKSKGKHTKYILTKLYTINHFWLPSSFLKI